MFSVLSVTNTNMNRCGKWAKMNHADTIYQHKCWSIVFPVHVCRAKWRHSECHQHNGDNQRAIYGKSKWCLNSPDSPSDIMMHRILHKSSSASHSERHIVDAIKPSKSGAHAPDDGQQTIAGQRAHSRRWCGKRAIRDNINNFCVLSVFHFVFLFSIRMNV